MRRFVTAASILLCAILASLAGSQVSAQESSGTISGFVRDATNGEPLIAATILVEGQPLGTITNESGYYVLPRVPVGNVDLVFTYIGFEPLPRRIELSAGANVRTDVRMVYQVVEAEETVIRADSMRAAESLYRKPISEVRLQARQINSMPQVAEADLMRALQTLPGVLPLSDFSSALYVRGGTPDQNLYMIDGTDVYNPEHTFGIFSTFNTDAIKQVELSKGGFGAQYGGRLSSVLSVTNLEGNREEFEGTASVSLLSAKSTLQMPLGERGSLSGSLRRTYFDQTAARFIDDVPDYYFYDGNIKAFLELSDRDQLTLSAYGGRDFLDVIFNPDATEETGFAVDWGNKTFSGRWTRVITPRTFGHLWVTGSRFSSDFLLDIADVIERNFVSDITVKGEFESHRSPRLITRFGFERKDLNVLFRQEFPDGLIEVNHRPEHYVFYSQTAWRPTSRWEVEAGARLNRFASDKTFTDVAPRLALKHRLTDTINLRASSGIYYQYLHRIPRFIATDIWVASNQDQDRSRAIHAIVGYQQELKNNFQFEVEAYWKGYSQIFAFNQTFLTELEETSHDEDGDPIFTNARGLFNDGDGHSVGLEVMLRKDSGALTGWAAYSLARTEYRFDSVNSDRDFTPRHDRTHVVNLVANVDLANAWRKLHSEPKLGVRGPWRLSSSFVYGSGQPITEPGSGYFTRTSPTQPGTMLRYAPTIINNVRLPAYVRLDVSLTWTGEIGSWTVAPYVQLFNAGNRSNVWFVDYDYQNNLPDIEAVSMFPMLPTIGVNLTF
ncbi:MAG: TonB-dependent receptor [Gemmatimonadetes bacterium]|nr:TonB-dependent receptor [Gemmatimonadota bacterium]MBT6149585.1 TonB-dependent receptor [Gemmatimonadota bacterium]MBT7862181.1 TonB-dependent receptor [Gemmatimonadota bacterium]